MPFFSDSDNVCVLHPGARPQDYVRYFDSRNADGVLPRVNRANPSDIVGYPAYRQVPALYNVSRLRLHRRLRRHRQSLSKVGDCLLQVFSFIIFNLIRVHRAKRVLA